MLGAVLRREREAILGVTLTFVTVLLLAATLAYLAERTAQPTVFGNIPRALWWTITTLTTTGYGDVVPVTPLGRVLGGSVMICGLAVFGLLAGILATGFATELKRREFLRTWDMVATVPFFQNIGAATISDVASLLRPRDLPARTIIVRRGHPGDCMYFIVSGEVEIMVNPPVRIGAGKFFGEIALLTGSPRNATVITTEPSQLLALDIADFRSLASRRPELVALIREEATKRLGQAAAAKTVKNIGSAGA
jgi:voltage-gated potassium channel